MYEIKEIRQKRAKVWEDAKAILKTAADEKRELTSEETAKYDAMVADVDKLKGEVERAERAIELDNELAASAGRKTESRIVTPDQLTRKDWNRMFRAWAGYGSRAANEADIEFARKVGFNPAVQELDARALTVTTATQGGNTVADEPMRSYYEVQKWYGAVRNVAQLITTETGGDLPVPTMNDTSNTGELVADSGAHTTTADPSIGQVVMKAYKYGSKAVLVSVELLQDASFDMAAYLGKALGTRIARIKNTQFTTGDNSGKPQGYTIGGSSGKTASATNAYTWSEINDLMHSVDPAYRAAPGCRFMAHDSQIGYIRKLNYASANFPVWEPSVQLGEPDRIFGYPVVVNNDMASNQATGVKVLAFGDFNTYMVREVGSPVFVRLNELYALNGQVAFLAFERADGRNLDSTAIKWMNLA